MKTDDTEELQLDIELTATIAQIADLGAKHRDTRNRVQQWEVLDEMKQLISTQEAVESAMLIHEALEEVYYEYSRNPYLISKMKSVLIAAEEGRIEDPLNPRTLRKKVLKYSVVCDDSNNPSSVIATGKLRVDVHLQMEGDTPGTYRRFHYGKG